MKRTLLLATAAIGTAMFPLGAAQAQTPFDWSGFYAGLHGGALSGTANSNTSGYTASTTFSEPIGGVLAGYNFANGLFLWGIEADIGAAAPPGSTAALLVDAVATVYDFALHWDAHVRARAAFPAGAFVPFVAGGVAFAGIDWANGISTTSDTFVGWTVGGGVDMRIAPKVTGRVEALYDSYGSKTYPIQSVGFDVWTVRAAVIFPLP